MSPRCSQCGRPIPPQLAIRLKEAFDASPLLCRQCIIDNARRGKMPKLVCASCGKQIEPGIVRRILVARALGRRVPHLCRDCFLRRRREPSLPERRLHTGPTDTVRDSVPADTMTGSVPADTVQEWDCVKCGASLEPEEVDMIKSGKTIKCEYCGSALTRELFR
ncbi:MAG: hypothetical protein HXY34_02045 [Candidatus Thorarchaeota archaeon]|nr:hypothetical protein [Candidatus Thorarchaeota archaeon]